MSLDGGSIGLATGDGMFRLELLPAAHGDSIWIEYGEPKKPRRIVIDGGPAATYEAGLHKRLLLLPSKDRRIDLLVVTHIDSDHIDGSIILLREAEQLGVHFGEIWFNAWAQLEKDEVEGFKPLQGEFLGALLDLPRYRECWNPRTKGSAIKVPDEGALPSWDLPDGARITLLSPGVRQINRLRARWVSALREFSPGDSEEALRRLESRRDYRPPAPAAVFGERSFGDDRSVANGSSIAFLLEHEGVSCLLAGDAHPRVLAASLKRLADSRNPGQGGALHVDAFKLSHHGSMSNMTEELLSAVECPRWIVSTNGAVYGHPDRQTAELVAQRSRGVPQFLCNYESATTLHLADNAKKPRWHTSYPGKGIPVGPAGGIVIDLSPAAKPPSKAAAGGHPRRHSAPSKRSTRA
jgi:beta-lactamase superfamily II metal-dependent hydrolase